MRRNWQFLLAAILWAVMAVIPCFSQEQSAVPLPESVKAVWDLGKAYHETTPTRERICINGLWRWQPAGKGTGGAGRALGLLQGSRMLAGNR